MKILISLTFALILGLFAIPAIAGGANSEVQDAMKRYVNSNTSEKGLFPLVYQGKILQLKLATSEKYPDGFHSGVKNEGSLYTSCADFVEPATGKKFDIDFLVNKMEGKYHVVQPIVHSVDGKKNPYDLAH